MSLEFVEYPAGRGFASETSFLISRIQFISGADNFRNNVVTISCDDRSWATRTNLPNDFTRVQERLRDEGKTFAQFFTHDGTWILVNPSLVNECRTSQFSPARTVIFFDVAVGGMARVVVSGSQAEVSEKIAQTRRANLSATNQQPNNQCKL